MFELIVDKDHIFNGVFIFMWLTYLWEAYLSYRQRQIYINTTEVPQDLKGILDIEGFEKARKYQLDRSNFGFWHGIWGQLESSLILLYNMLPILWNYSGYLLLKYTGLESEHEVLQTIIFAVLGSVVSTILDLPWFYGEKLVLNFTALGEPSRKKMAHIAEVGGKLALFETLRRVGFTSNQGIGALISCKTPAFFVKDKIKKFVVNQVIMIPIIASIVEIIAVGGDYLFLYLWLFTLSVSVLLIMVYADYIAPLFDKFAPLPDGELKQKIEDLAASIDFPLKKLYVVEGMAIVRGNPLI
ncbi:CAAX prenyl protease 1 [Nymphon striatum]|nr:CAAX prenyl protease 1 [Nymphon striatum]